MIHKHRPETATITLKHAEDSKIEYGSKKSSPFLAALTEVWRVSQYGEKKHGANNWKSAKPEGMHYYEEALWRHWILRRQGEVFDQESECRHLAHLAWNALMLLEMECRKIVSPEWVDQKIIAELRADVEDYE